LTTRNRPADPGLAPELALLLCCARLVQSPEQRARASRLVAGPMDWDLVFDLGARHKLLPLLALHLREQDAVVPGHVRDRLRTYSLQNAGRVLLVVGELIGILRSFEQAGIQAVPYKGAALAAQLYGNLALRPAGDIDIVVRRDDVSRARAVLSARGYQPRHTLGTGGEAFMVRSRYSEDFSGPTRHPVELHWGFTNRDIAFPLDLDALSPRLESIRLGPHAVLAFALDDLLLLLCVHGSKHRWDRIEWICGVAEAVRRGGELDWNALLDRAGHLGVRRMLLLGLLLAHDHLGAPVPSPVLSRARRDPTVPGLATRVPPLWLEPSEGDESGSLPTDLFRLGLRERFRDRARFVLYRLTTPSQPERWSTRTIGGVMLPLHAFTRPLRLLRHLGPALRWYGTSWRDRV
jgi:hypothetical protein